MRHLASLTLLVAGAAAFTLGLGPAFFGQPLTGVPLLLAGLGLELACWLRLRHRRDPVGGL
ncbi:MAG TPA: glycosyl transferase family 39 [Frateuria sp.]|uniref:glycosyl transferase family 39 n=1 Tax=Frateuria sp. TaxID=2211372 RepID=UPI002D7F81B7|nr:glycosyl transferase family 39 [Frateuria sp.]HET6806179.1 glycosyl transferase family 39 [Frateuria sp.]